MDLIIKSLREQHSYSQDELAQELGISRQTYIKYENGSCDMPLEIVRKLSKLFDLDYSCLIDNVFPSEPQYNIQKSNQKIPTCDIRIDISENNIEKFKQVALRLHFDKKTIKFYKNICTFYKLYVIIK